MGPDDGVGRTARNGLNFTERGFGVRAAVGCSDRGHTAASQLKPGDIDWDGSSRRAPAGSTPAASSPRSPRPPRSSPARPWPRRRHGTIVSYDLNYRPPVEVDRRQGAAREVNRELAPTST
jgi:2-dehydro-3-deoxygluconokinase